MLFRFKHRPLIAEQGGTIVNSVRHCAGVRLIRASAVCATGVHLQDSEDTQDVRTLLYRSLSADGILQCSVLSFQHRTPIPSAHSRGSNLKTETAHNVSHYINL